MSVWFLTYSSYVALVPTKGVFVCRYSTNDVHVSFTHKSQPVACVCTLRQLLRLLLVWSPAFNILQCNGCIPAAAGRKPSVALTRFHASAHAIMAAHAFRTLTTGRKSISVHETRASVVLPRRVCTYRDRSCLLLWGDCNWWRVIVQYSHCCHIWFQLFKENSKSRLAVRPSRTFDWFSEARKNYLFVLSKFNYCCCVLILILLWCVVCVWLLLFGRFQSILSQSQIMIYFRLLRNLLFNYF